jgi:hypothetical protein
LEYYREIIGNGNFTDFTSKYITQEALHQECGSTETSRPKIQLNLTEKILTELHARRNAYQRNVFKDGIFGNSSLNALEYYREIIGHGNFTDFTSKYMTQESLRQECGSTNVYLAPLQHLSEKTLAELHTRRNGYRGIYSEIWSNGTMESQNQNPNLNNETNNFTDFTSKYMTQESLHQECGSTNVYLAPIQHLSEKTG